MTTEPTSGPWEWDGVAVSNADGQPWMEWQPLDPYLGEDRDQEYDEARKQADGAFIAQARTLVPALQAEIAQLRRDPDPLTTSELAHARRVAGQWQERAERAEAAAIEERAKALLYQELYTWRASHDPEPIIQTWENVTEYDRQCFRQLAAKALG